MTILDTELLTQACRIFLRLAYAGGEDAVPANKLHLLDIPGGHCALEYVPKNVALSDCCHIVRTRVGKTCGMVVRLGCDHYPHLKLKAHLVDGTDSVWLFSVDTHDSFSAASFLPLSDHPDAAAWRSIQLANVALKQTIEAAWEEAGLPTFNGLLRRDLESGQPCTTEAAPCPPN